MLGFSIPKITDFTDDQVIEAATKLLGIEPDRAAAIVNSMAGQAVLARIRDKESEESTVLCRCPECEFAFETSIN